MNNGINQQKQQGIEINIFSFLKELSKKIWIILLIVVIAGAGSGVLAKILSKDTYTSSVSFIVNTLTENEMAESSAVSAQVKITNTFKYILSGRVLKEAIVEACPIKDVDYDTVDKSMVVETVTETNVVEVKITTEDADLSYAIANTLVEVYGDIVSEIYSNAKLTVCDTPVKPELPTATHVVTVVAVSVAFASAALTILIMLIMFLVKDTVKTSEELSRKINIPVLGAVQVVTNKNDGNKCLLITDKHMGFSFIETYKAIRTKIISHSAKTGDNVYLVTSACENEGKTTATVNIALSIAETGKSVLIIDADLRNPSISKFLSLPKVDKGFADVIKGTAELNNVIKLVENLGIYVLCDQKSESNPSELLLKKSTEDIIESVRKEFDFVIIDTPPASIVTDTSVIAGMTDAAIMVIREDFAPFSRIRMSVDDIDANGSEILGCIFNMDSSTVAKNKKYGRYKRGYGKYGYGKYGYGKYGYGRYGYGKYGYGAYGNYDNDKK